MPEISLTEDQHERLEQVRADVEEAFVEDYGYIPIEDALQYLLDTYTPPEERDAVNAYERLATAEYPQLQAVASEVPDVPGSGIDADEMRGKLLAELGVAEFAAKLEATVDEAVDGTAARPDTEPGTESGTDSASGATRDSPHSGEGTGETADGGDATGGDSTGEATSEHAASGGSATEGSGDSAEGEPAGQSSRGGGISIGSGGGGDPLAAVNRMLQEHDGKWRESGGEEPYEVDLPDGGTESARTRDDVRQLLFRHY